MLPTASCKDISREGTCTIVSFKTASSKSVLEQSETYWDERSISYSASTQRECATWLKDAWAAEMACVLDELTPGAQILDIGAGPGFFSILCAQAGFGVTAIDASPEMLAHARANAEREGVADQIQFVRGDVCSLPFDAAAFDAVVTRNVTWNLEYPDEAYADWRRVLKPGGWLLNFDANWYTYLNDDELARENSLNQQDFSVLNSSYEYEATDDQCARCEIIARQLPLTYEQRPEWDVRALRAAGFSQIEIDERVSERVWSPGEQTYYAATPLFKIRARV